jgi:cell division protein FtsB
MHTGENSLHEVKFGLKFQKNLNCFLRNSIYNKNSTFYMPYVTLNRPSVSYLTLYRLSLGGLAATFLIILFAFGTLIHQAHRRYCYFENKVLALKKQVQLAEEKVVYKEIYIHKLEQDEVFLEKILRERLGYSTSSDLIFRFESKPGAF